MSINRWIWTKRWNIYKIEHYSVIKKEWNDVIYSNMDGPRDYYTKWSKSVQSLICVQLCDPMDCSTPGLPVHHQLLELTQLMSIESVMPSSHLIFHSPPSSPALNLSQHQGLFQWIGPLHQVAKVLELQHMSLQWIFRVDFLDDWLVWSPCCC